MTQRRRLFYKIIILKNYFGVVKKFLKFIASFNVWNPESVCVYVMYISLSLNDYAKMAVIEIDETRNPSKS